MMLANFLRRWSTVEITDDNAFLYEEHAAGVRALANETELALLSGLSRTTPRAIFAERYAALTAQGQLPSAVKHIAASEHERD